MKTAKVVIAKNPVSAAFSCPYCHRRFAWGYGQYISGYGNTVCTDVTCPSCGNAFRLDDNYVKED